MAKKGESDLIRNTMKRDAGERRAVLTEDLRLPDDIPCVTNGITYADAAQCRHRVHLQADAGTDGPDFVRLLQNPDLMPGLFEGDACCHFRRCRHRR